MQLRNSGLAYGIVPIFVHWLTVALVSAGWLLGTFGDDLPRGTARAAGLFVHMSFGLTVLALLALRLGWRIVDPPPPFEETRFGSWLQVGAKATHFLLYALVLATPIIGIVLQFARGEAVPLYGIAEVASPWARDRALGGLLQQIHEVLADGLMIVAGLHAAAALVHHWMLRDSTLVRMLPWAAR